MHLTRESEYALLGLAHLAEYAAHDAPISVAEVAVARQLPAHFLSKIFQKLARAGIIVGGRGRGQGYALARPPGHISMREILEAIEGEESLQGCLLWQGYCGDANPCPLHHRLREVHENIRAVLAEVMLAEYLEGAGHVGTRS
jgi:Rrf2 family protein